MTAPPFDPNDLHVVDSPADTFPDAPDVEPVKPDHTANGESAIDRVRRRVKDSPSPKPRATRTRKPKPRATRPGELVEPLMQLYTAGGMVLMPFDPTCGQAVLENAESCAKSIDELARQNDAVRRACLALTQSTAWGGVLIAHLPLIAVVMSHHGPASFSDSLAPLSVVPDPTGEDDDE